MDGWVDNQPINQSINQSIDKPVEQTTRLRTPSPFAQAARLPAFCLLLLPGVSTPQSSSSRR
jgi:hypothetical protein